MVLSTGGAIAYYQRGADGIVDISPFTCMNGIVTEAVYPRVSKDHDNIPIRVFYFDGTHSDLDRDVGIFLELAKTYKRRKKISAAVEALMRAGQAVTEHVRPPRLLRRPLPLVHHRGLGGRGRRPHPAGAQHQRRGGERPAELPPQSAPSLDAHEMVKQVLPRPGLALERGARGRRRPRGPRRPRARPPTSSPASPPG